MPTRKEMLELEGKIKNPPDALVEQEYAKLVETFEKLYKVNQSVSVERKDNDIVVDGRSLKEASRFKAQEIMREIALINLVGFEEGQELFALSYEEISESFSPAQIKHLTDLIEKAVNPDYKDVEKN
jgi:predicted S18 family serine protease